MNQTFYQDRDYAFGQNILALRTNTGLSQQSVAEYLGVSRRTISEWEAGNSYPKIVHLQKFIELAFEHNAFVAGCEGDQVRKLWQSARQKAFLNEVWLDELINQSTLLPLTPEPKLTISNTELPIFQSKPHHDWGTAPSVPVFYGREEERRVLAQWAGQERCRVITVVGIGGIGKTALTVTVMREIASQFEVVVWRSLRDAPSCEVLLAECLQAIDQQSLREMPNSPKERLRLLLEYMQTRRILLVLDNLETLMQDVINSGQLRTGFEDYAQLLQQVANTSHQSCLVLTSREKLIELAPLEGTNAPVRSLRLAGVDTETGRQLLTEKDITSSPTVQARLIELYQGNPLVLKIVSQTIVELFGGEIGLFLEEGQVVFGEVLQILAEQFQRLSALEQTILYWLAILREPVRLEDLRIVLDNPAVATRMLEVFEGLNRRSLIERGQTPGTFTLQSVVLEYATARLVTETAKEIEQGQLNLLISCGLCHAHSKEYIRKIQEQLVIIPVLNLLRNSYRETIELENHLLGLLNRFRNNPAHTQGYAPANLVVLLYALHHDLRGYDFSQLILRGLYLQGIPMQDTSLARATVRDTIFTEAFDAAWEIAVSPDGQYWAVGNGRGDVQVWREEGKQLHLAWQAHSELAWAVIFSPDSRTLATAGNDGAIKLWNIEDGTLVWTVWQTASVHTLTFAPDGRTLTSGGEDGTVRLWDVTNGTQQATLLEHPFPIYSVAWSPDGEWLAAGGADGGIWLWKPQNSGLFPLTQHFVGHSSWVSGLAFSPDGAKLASASFDGTAKIWDLTDKNPVVTLTGHHDRVYSVAWSPDGHILASSSFDKTILLWEVEKGSYRSRLRGHSAVVYGVVFTPDGRRIVSCSDDRTVRVWEVAGGQCVHTIQGYAISLYDLAWRPDGKELVSAGSDTLVIMWDIVTGTPTKTLQRHKWGVFGAGWSPDGQWLATSGWGDNGFLLWKADSGKLLKVLQGDPQAVGAIFQGVEWSPDGRLLATGSYLHGVQVWEMPGCKLRWIGQTQSTRVRRVAWNFDGTRLAGGGDDGYVYVWDALTGALQQKLAGHEGVVRSVAWRPDGTKLASAGGKEAGELFVWDAVSGEQLQALTNYTHLTYTVVWSRDGKELITGDSDGCLRSWSGQDGECLRVQQGHQGTVQSLRFSPDGAILASCGDDGAIVLWNFARGEKLQTFRLDRPYERLNITGIKGLTPAQKAALLNLGAFEEL